jgi:crotonobetaine/carnitine-CoA ligase
LTAGDPGAPLTVVGSRTVPALLHAGASDHPDRPLLVFEDAVGEVSTYSWKRVADLSTAFGARLAALGIGRGDRIHVHLPNRPEFLVAWFAAAQLGAVIVPTNTNAVAAELSFVLEHSRASVSLTDAEGRQAVRSAWDLLDAERPILLCEEERLLDQLPPARRRPADAVPGDLLSIMYTSGTTSRPKGVRITHANYVYAGEVVASALRLTREDRFLIVLPLFHANAQCYATMSTLVSGGTLILAARFSASRALDQAARLRATVTSLFAAPMRMILAQDPSPLWREHNLRVVVFAQNLSDAELARWDALVGAPLLQLYGMTETVGPPLMNPLDGERRHNTVGRPVLGYACRIVRADGSPTAVGEPGELLVSGIPGISLMDGYLDDAAATASAFVDGWLRTGDIVARDAEGYVTFIDRDKDMIKRAGENIAASEVEAVLLSHPAVRDAAVFGVPDEIRDEQVIAYVVASRRLEPGSHELVAWCAEHLAKFRVPQHVEIVAELPRTAVGKVMKHVLRADYINRRTGLHR